MSKDSRPAPPVPLPTLPLQVYLGTLSYPFYITDHYFCTACLGEMAPGKIDNSNFLSSFAPSRA